jgi:hypothetical protein
MSPWSIMHRMMTFLVGNRRRLSVEELDDVSTVGSLAPDFTEAQAWLQHRVEELANAGAIDEGSLPVFIKMVDSWVDEWKHQVGARHDNRYIRLFLQQAEAQANLDHHKFLADIAENELRRVDDQLRRLRQDE